MSGYLDLYADILIQEFRAEVGDGDLTVTFFDDELIGALRRTSAVGEWRTNASLGASEMGVTSTPDQESIARALKRSFPECRIASVDMLDSGRILEINAFPGGDGLLHNYGIVLGEVVMDRLEAELLGTGAERRRPRSPGRRRSRHASRPARAGRRSTTCIRPATRSARSTTSSARSLPVGDPRPGHVRGSQPEYILSIQHAGLFVPEMFREHFLLGDAAPVEIDLYSDLCYEMADGMHLRSELAPFFVDMNRTRDGADDGEFPHHLTNPAHEYYSVEDSLMLIAPYSAAEEEEVLSYHDLYHRLLGGLIDRMRRERGYALVFDCHSMTSTGLGRVHDKSHRRNDFVAGTLAGTSAHRVIIDSFMTTLRSEASGHGLGLTVGRDVPYSGGFKQPSGPRPKPPRASTTEATAWSRNPSAQMPTKSGRIAELDAADHAGILELVQRLADVRSPACVSAVVSVTAGFEPS